MKGRNFEKEWGEGGNTNMDATEKLDCENQG